ncbi:MAG: hypothetical protein AAGG56_05880 [Pseudomonadota bacterium]
MSALILLGALLIAAGLFGLGYCIWKGFQIRRSNLPSETVNSVLHRLIAVNLGSVALATFGLVLLFIGLSF